MTVHEKGASKEEVHCYYPLIKFFDFPDGTRLSVIHQPDERRKMFKPVGYAINIDEVCICNKALTEKQIQKMMNYKPNLRIKHW